LRVLPILQTRGRGFRDDSFADLVLPVFRATGAAWSAAKYPAQATEFKNAAARAYAAYTASYAAYGASYAAVANAEIKLRIEAETPRDLRRPAFAGALNVAASPCHKDGIFGIATSGLQRFFLLHPSRC
jgi:hypothetical protein